MRQRFNPERERASLRNFAERWERTATLYEYRAERAESRCEYEMADVWRERAMKAYDQAGDYRARAFAIACAG